MSEYIHEIVLQDYIIENIESLNLMTIYTDGSYNKIIEARYNTSGTFWDLEGKLENGIWIPIEVEWISQNFISHNHTSSKQFKTFKDKNGILVVLRKNKQIDGVKQISLLDNITETKMLKDFKIWFQKKSMEEYIPKTLEKYFVGNYKRQNPRILLYHLSKKAEKNYFINNKIYKKTEKSPAWLGFREKAYKNNMYIRDIQENDIIVFLNCTGRKCKRVKFIEDIKNKKVRINRISAYRCKSKIDTKNTDNFYWKDEEKNEKSIYPYICEIEKEPFFEKQNINMPYIKSFTDSTWEAIRSCLHHGEYREISYMDFMIFISNLK